MERLEVVGEGANVVVENGIRLKYFRPAAASDKASHDLAESYFGPDDTAPIIWEPDFSLGQLYNKQLFLEGYVGCLRYFAEHILSDETPYHGNLVDILHLMSVHDKILSAADHVWTPT